MKRRRIYGNDETHISLTDKAERAYSNYEPLDIEEVPTEDGKFWQSITGKVVEADYFYRLIDGHNAVVMDEMTEQDVNDYFEEMADEDAERTIGSTLSVEEFVKRQFDTLSVTPERMSIAEAQDDIHNFLRDAWELPEGITAEEYANVWNALVDEYNEEG